MLHKGDKIQINGTFKQNVEKEKECRYYYYEFPTVVVWKIKVLSAELRIEGF